MYCKNWGKKHPMVCGHFEQYKEGPALVVGIVDPRQSPGIDLTKHSVSLKESNLILH